MTAQKIKISILYKPFYNRCCTCQNNFISPLHKIFYQIFILFLVCGIKICVKHIVVYLLNRMHSDLYLYRIIPSSPPLTLHASEQSKNASICFKKRSSGKIEDVPI